MGNNKTKMKILNVLEGKENRVIHIEISKSEYVEGKFNIRVGNILGSSEHSNIDREMILKEIEDEINSL